jgi:hypothetical protein
VSNTCSFDRSIGVALARHVEQAVPAEVGLWPRVEAAVTARRGPSRRRAVGLALAVLALSSLALTPVRTFAVDRFQQLHEQHSPVDHGPHAPVDPHHAR